MIVYQCPNCGAINGRRGEKAVYMAINPPVGQAITGAVQCLHCEMYCWLDWETGTICIDRRWVPA